MGAHDFVEEEYHTTRGEWWVRARDEECSRLYIQCGRAWSARQVNPEGWCASCRIDKPEDASRNDTATVRHLGLLVRSALPEDFNSMATGGDVKETVMTILFLLVRTCFINMITDLEKRFTSDGNKRRALAQPEAPWKWFTSYELGFPLVSDEHDTPMHPLVETFVDDQLPRKLTGPRRRKPIRPFLPPSVNSRHWRRDGARHLVWRLYGEHLLGSSYPDQFGRTIQNGGGSLAPPLAGLQLPGGYKDRPAQRKSPSGNHGQGPQLQVVCLENSSAG